MKSHRVVFALVAALGLGTPALIAASVPPAEQLLPADTLAVASVPDAARLSAAQKDAPIAKFWRDPAMAPFREKFEAKVKADLLEPLERQLGAKLSEFQDLVQGQLTVALTQNGWTGGPGEMPGLLLILDTKDKSDLLKKLLATVRTKLSESGQKSRIEKIRDVEFTVIPLPDFDKPVGGPEKPKEEASGQPSAPEASAVKRELAFGQMDSVLLAGSNLKDLEKLMIRLSGGAVPSLAEQPGFEAIQKTVFREAQIFVWANFSSLIDALLKGMNDSAAKNPNPMAPKPAAILSALGLPGLKSLAMAARLGSEGASSEIFVAAPEDKRKGLLNLLTVPPKEVGPPPFVPLDATKYGRWRVDGQRVWTTLESALNEISPGMLNFVVGQIETALKEKNPDFSVRKNLVGNLGDDILSYQKAAKGTSLDELNSPPSILLLGSSNAEQLLQALRSMLVMMPIPGGAGDLKDREFLGRKIYTLALPQTPGLGGGAPVERSLHATASGGYLALSTDTAMVEEYLRSSDTKPKPLSELAGLNDALQKVGGTSAALLGYQDDKENIRTAFEMLRVNSDLVLGSISLALKSAKPEGTPDKGLKEWVDFALLPKFEKVSNYFTLSVYAGRSTPEGFTVKYFTPAPVDAK